MPIGPEAALGAVSDGCVVMTDGKIRYAGPRANAPAEDAARPGDP